MSKPKTPTDLNVEALQEEVGKIKETVERLQTNWDKDREDFQEQKNKFAHWEVEMKSLQEIIQKLPQLNKEKIQEALEPATQEVQDLKNVIQEKKMVAVDNLETQKQLKKSWWRFWKK